MTNATYKKGDLVKLVIPNGTYGTVVEVVNGTSVRRYLKKFGFSFGVEDGTLIVEYMPGILTYKRRNVVPYSPSEVRESVSKVEDLQAEINGLEGRLTDNLDSREKERIGQALEYLKKFL